MQGAFSSIGATLNNAGGLLGKLSSLLSNAISLTRLFLNIRIYGKNTKQRGAQRNACLHLNNRNRQILEIFPDRFRQLFRGFLVEETVADLALFVVEKDGGRVIDRVPVTGSTWNDHVMSMIGFHDVVNFRFGPGQADCIDAEIFNIFLQ